MDKKNRNSKAVKSQLQTLLNEIANSYDFSQFTLEGFIRWVEQQRGRELVFVARPMPSTLFGAWMADDSQDYVFYEKNTLPIHQAHIQLHEMAHMLCDHPTTEVSPQELGVLLGYTSMDPAAYESLLLRSTHSDEAELEAETLAALIQERVLHYDRIQELAKAISSSNDFAVYFADYIKTVEI